MFFPTVDPLLSQVQHFLALFGENASMFVEISHVPFPDVNLFKWFYNGLLLQNNEKYNISLQETMIRLLITDVQISDSGSYTVFVSNTASSSETISVNVTVQGTYYIDFDSCCAFIKFHFFVTFNLYS